MELEKVKKNEEREDIYLDEVLEKNGDIEESERREIYKIIASEVLENPAVF